MQNKGKKPVVIALGMFDGVHAGHRALLRHTVETARAEGWESVVYTFSNHPRSLFGRDDKLLTTEEERVRCMKKLGLEHIQMELFDRDIAMLSPAAFTDMLLERYDARAFVVGFNYTFGQGSQGTPETLLTLGKERGFFVHVIPPVLYEGTMVSSTRIRQLIETGEMEAANAMLCGPYTLTGEVVRNWRIGTAIGFPTANIAPSPEKVLPCTGVYATSVRIGKSVLEGVTNVGNNPTVRGNKLTVETHVLDFDGDLYGREISVQFHKRLRGEVRYPDIQALVEQIAQDVEDTRAWFARGKNLEVG